MIIINFPGDLTDILAKKEALSINTLSFAQ